MSPLQEAEKLLSQMSPAEKAQLLQRVAQDLNHYPGIESNPNVQGGYPCIVRTRIPVWVLIRASQLGVTEADLLDGYPTLSAADLANAQAYYRSHRDEIEQQIAENETEEKDEAEATIEAA